MHIDFAKTPMLVAWEATRSCNLACVHCRAEAQLEPDPEELTTEEAFGLVDEIAKFARPIFIITGGEPLYRRDVFEVAEYAAKKGFHVAMSPNGTLLTPENVKRMKEVGVQRISVSLDGSSPEKHDDFRMVPGAFAATVQGLKYAQEVGLPYQINTTVTKRNVDNLPQMKEKVIELGAEAWDIFMLVPTGRGKLEDEVSPQRYEEVLHWVYDQSLDSPIQIKVTCGPMYMRVVHQRGGKTPRQHGRGCMAGNGFVFVSHKGEVFPCGYFPVQAGNIRQESFKDIYQESSLFKTLRDPSKLVGKCAICEYKETCFGCRARAYGASGNYMAAEPFCVYRPGQS